MERFATTLRADFRFSPLNALLLVAIFVAGLFVHLAIYSFTVQAVTLFLGSAFHPVIAGSNKPAAWYGPRRDQ